MQRRGQGTKQERSGDMKATRAICLSTVAAIGLAMLLAAPPAELSAQQTPAAAAGAAVSIGDSDIGGVVTSANGAEAGVWVIAETTDLPTKSVKHVVTDAQGR